MKTIWKYPLQITDEQEISVPAGAEILTVQSQYGQPCLWALVNTESKQEERIIKIIGTGNPIDKGENLRYISTFQMMNGEYIFHAFELLKQ